jgi:acyl-CoA thioester hydrolase
VAEIFEHRVAVRYLEVDRQGVVFNMWYLAYFDDAMTALLADRGMPYQHLLDAGLDVQVVHTEMDWTGSVRWQEDVRVSVRATNVGTTSFSLSFEVRANGSSVCVGETVYVVVSTDGSGKQAIPPGLRRALQLD